MVLEQVHCIAEADEEATNVLQNMLITQKNTKTIEKMEEKQVEFGEL